MTRRSKVAMGLKKKATEKPQEASPRLLIPTGSTLYNLSCSDKVAGAWETGRMANIIGDSGAGKTFLALSVYAECNLIPDFDEYAFVYDDAEHANSFPLVRLFGQECADRIEAPRTEDGDESNSKTMEEFMYNINQWCKGDKPFIYILDSFDAIGSKEDEDMMKKLEKEIENGKEQSGSYGASKAKLASQLFRNIVSKLERTNSFLLVISQVRDNINAGMFQSKKTRSGGRALKFYACHESWVTLVKRFEKTVKNKKREIGVNALIKTTKNKLTGKRRQAPVHIYYAYGIDDIAANIDFLMECGEFKKAKLVIKAKALNFEGTKEKLIDHIEGKGKEKKLRRLVSRCWREIEESLISTRKSRY